MSIHDEISKANAAAKAEADSLEALIALMGITQGDE